MSSTTTTYSAFLKRRFPQDKFVRDQIGKNRPFFEAMKMKTDFSGKSTNIPILHQRPQGVASTRAKAQSNATNVQGKEQVIQNGRYAASVYIGLEVLLAARNNAGAFLDNKTAEIESLYDEALDNIAYSATGNGGNSIGKVDANYTSGNDITLEDPADAFKFEVGMTIVTAAADGATSTDSVDSGSTTVTAIDRATGILTVDDATDLTGLAASRFIFRDGDFAGDSGTVVLKGIQTIVAGSATPDALYGLTAGDRAVDPWRFGGVYIASGDLTNLNDEERIQLLGVYMKGRAKSTPPKTGYLHPENWNNLSLSLQQRGYIPRTDPDSKWGHQYLSVNTGGVEQKIKADPFFPKDIYFALNHDHLFLDSMGALLGPVDQDGVTILRSAVADTFEHRLVSFPVIFANSFVRHGRAALNAA